MTNCGRDAMDCALTENTHLSVSSRGYVLTNYGRVILVEEWQEAKDDTEKYVEIYLRVLVIF